MMRVMPTVKNVQWDALNVVHDEEAKTFSTVDVVDGCLCLSIVPEPIPFKQIHELLYLESRHEENVPRADRVGGTPLFYGGAVAEFVSLSITLRNDLKHPIYVCVFISLECTLSGARWTVLLPDQAKRCQVGGKYKASFLEVAPVVRKNRVARELDNIMRGIPCMVNGIVFHRDRLEHRVPKSGFVNSLLGRYDTQSCSYSEVSVTVLGDHWFSPDNVTASFMGYPEATLRWSRTKTASSGVEYLIEPLVSHLRSLPVQSHTNQTRDLSRAAPRLLELQRLREMGLISKEEYDAKRGQVLAEL